jgi:hypothetical protein
MGFFSWFRSCGTTGYDEPTGQPPPSLIRSNDDPRFDEMRQAVAEDLAEFEQDNRPSPEPDERGEPEQRSEPEQR